MSVKPDGIALTLYQNRFKQIAEEMGETLKRSAFSPNIKEREDHSCAVFNQSGEMVAQAAHIPVHLGAMPATMQAVLEAFTNFEAGDVVLVNDPFSGGTHLPDITLLTPLFYKETLSFFLVSRAHHSDVGGMTPGSMPLSTEVFQEGLILPPCKLFSSNHKNEALWQVVLANTRTPEEREGDLKAQLAAHAIGAKRLTALMDQEGADVVLSMTRHLLDYGEEKAREAIGHWPEAKAHFSDVIWVPGCNEQCVIDCEMTIEEKSIHFDFSNSSDQVHGPINAVRSIVDSAVYYVCRTLWPLDMPHNGGTNRPIRITSRAGSIIDAHKPAGVVGGNVETSQRLVDVLYGAFAKVLPERVPAASQGTMNNLTIGGFDHQGRPYSYYETIAGGHGAHAAGKGLSGRQSHMTNTRNTPIEAIEQTFPFWIKTSALRAGSGGAGKEPGGDGLVRTYVFEKTATVTLFASRRQSGPYGLRGGERGAPGKQIKINTNGMEEVLPDSFSIQFNEGEQLQIHTPGGGGYGQTPNKDN